LQRPNQARSESTAPERWFLRDDQGSGAAPGLRPSAPLVMVVEAPEFIRRIEKLLDDDERETLIAYLAPNPTVGDLLERAAFGSCGGPGRSWRLAVAAFLLTAFAKNVGV
jgi:hypothetical protein